MSGWAELHRVSKHRELVRVGNRLEDKDGRKDETATRGQLGNAPTPTTPQLPDSVWTAAGIFSWGLRKDGDLGVCSPRVNERDMLTLEVTRSARPSAPGLLVRPSSPAPS